MTEEFTKREIEALKELARQRIFIEDIFFRDPTGKKYPYRNRFETWDDAYMNLKGLGFTHQEILQRIGERKNERGK